MNGKRESKDVAQLRQQEFNRERECEASTLARRGVFGTTSLCWLSQVGSLHLQHRSSCTWWAEFEPVLRVSFQVCVLLTFQPLSTYCVPGSAPKPGEAKFKGRALHLKTLTLEGKMKEGGKETQVDKRTMTGGRALRDLEE